MSMSTHVEGIIPPDHKWRQMKQAWEACEIAQVEVPEEVLKFFNHRKPDEMGVIVDIENSVNPYQDKEYARTGFEVNIDRLPPHVKIIRFYNSW